MDGESQNAAKVPAAPTNEDGNEGDEESGLVGRDGDGPTGPEALFWSAGVMRIGERKGGPEHLPQSLQIPV